MDRRRRRASVAAHRNADPWQWEEVPGVESPVTYWGKFVMALRSSRFSVQVYDRETEWGPVMQLVVRRHDGGTVISWAELQRIKNELAGANRLAIEVFPPVEQLIDNANLFHLWVLPRGFVLPFGLGEGIVG